MVQHPPPKSIALSAGTIRYHDVGEGPPLLFVHGFLANSRLWHKVVAGLRESYRCIVPDWPLGSHSVAFRADADLSQPAIVEVMNEFVGRLGLDRFTLVANDMGGALSQQFVAAHPEKVQRLVLTPCDVFENYPPGMFRYLKTLPTLPGAGVVLANVMKLKAMRRLPVTYGWLGKHGLDDATIAAFLDPMIHDAGVRRDAIKVMRQVGPEILTRIRTQLEAFPAKVDIVWPPEDKAFPFADAKRLAATFRNATLTEVRDSYTFVALDQPQAVIDVIHGGRNA